MEVLGEDVRRIRPEIRAEIFLHGRVGHFGKVLRDLAFVIAPRKVVVRLRKAELREVIHDLRTREGFREKDQLRMLRLQRADAPLPESEGLGVRVVDAEDLHPVIDPELKDAAEFFP